MSILPLQDPRIDKTHYERNFSSGKFAYKKQLYIVEHKVILCVNSYFIVMLTII